jgi:hypothetical protein
VSKPRKLYYGKSFEVPVKSLLTLLNKYARSTSDAWFQGGLPERLSFEPNCNTWHASP